MLSSMAKVSFLLQSKSENAPIYLRLSISRGNTPKRKTGLSINYKDWSTKTNLPKQTTAENKNLSMDHQELESKILKIEDEANANGIEINGNWLEHQIDLEFNRITEMKQSALLTHAIQEIINNARSRKDA